MGPLDDQVVREDSLTATPDGLDVAIYTHWYRALPLPSLARVDLTARRLPLPWRSSDEPFPLSRPRGAFGAPRGRRPGLRRPGR